MTLQDSMCYADMQLYGLQSGKLLQHTPYDLLDFKQYGITILTIRQFTS